MSSTSTLFPYTTLFRSIRGVSEEATCGAQQLQPLLLSGPQMNPGEREQLAAAWGSGTASAVTESGDGAVGGRVAVADERDEDAHLIGVDDGVHCAHVPVAVAQAMPEGEQDLLRDVLVNTRGALAIVVAQRQRCRVAGQRHRQ